MSLFSAVELAPRDPILGLNEQFNADPNPAKVNLGVGVYFDENGKLPLLKCVAEAEALMQASPKPRGYLPIDGIAAYDQAVQGLVFGADCEAVTDEVLSAVVEDARCADVSPSAPSVRSSSRCRPRHWAASVFPAATAKPSSGCAVVHR